MDTIWPSAKVMDCVSSVSVTVSVLTLTSPVNVTPAVLLVMVTLPGLVAPSAPIKAAPPTVVTVRPPVRLAMAPKVSVPPAVTVRLLSALLVMAPVCRLPPAPEVARARGVARVTAPRVIDLVEAAETDPANCSVPVTAVVTRPPAKVATSSGASPKRTVRLTAPRVVAEPAVVVVRFSRNSKS